MKFLFRHKESKQCDKHTKIYDGEDWEELFKRVALKESAQTKDTPTTFEVANEWPITCCRKLHEEGFENIACLNFACPINPCAAMERGHLAQEESLGYCSALYSSLSKQESHYQENQKNSKNYFYRDCIIYSPGCVVFRNNGNYSLLENPFKVDFISCSAVNASRIRAPLKKVKEVMRRRAKAILAVASDQGCDALVLGAWGTACFKNNVKDVVMYFKELLLEVSDQNTAPEYGNKFHKIVFAVWEGKETQIEFKTAFLGEQVLSSEDESLKQR